MRLLTGLDRDSRTNVLALCRGERDKAEREEPWTVQQEGENVSEQDRQAAGVGSDEGRARAGAGLSPGAPGSRGRMPQWNNSTLTTLERCGEMFRRRYIENEYVPPAPRMLRGTVVHRVAAEAMLRKLEKAEELVTVEEARDLAATDFEQRWAGGVTLSDEDSVALGPDRAKAESKDFAVELSGFYVQAAAPRIEPVAVERHIVVRPKDSDLVIHGTMDLIARNTETGREVIRDTKTSEKSPTQSAAETSQQLTMYGMLRHAETGQLPDRMTLDYLVRTPKTHERKHVQLHTRRDAGDVGALVNRLNTAVEAVKRGVFMPTAPDSWWCSAKWCTYHSSCVYVRRGARPTS